jgi:5-deoxy-glucuronate isomerase
MSRGIRPLLNNMVFRRTNTKIGRHVTVSPENSRMRHLSYGRIILNSTRKHVRFGTGERETGLICLAGEADISSPAGSSHLSRYDAIYFPRDSKIEIHTETSADFAEFSADVTGRYPVHVVRHEDVVKDPGLHFSTGGTGCRRQVNLMLAKNIEAGRLLAGFTHSEDGNWTSWPPHEHAKLAEEMYVYFDMPFPAYGIQLVYADKGEPEVATVVRDGDAVLMPRGYHPNVAVPGHRIAFLWAMAAHQEGKGRQFGVVNVQPGFQSVSSGLEAGRKQDR